MNNTTKYTLWKLSDVIPTYLSERNVAWDLVENVQDTQDLGIFSLSSQLLFFYDM